MPDRSRSDGIPMWSMVFPGYKCPSYNMDMHPWGRPKLDRAFGNYTASMGNQLMPSYNNQCTLYQGNNFGNGPAGHGNSQNARDISGPFSRGCWAARFADITDGTANVIAMGEVLPHKGDHSINGWMHFNSMWFATSAPINFPVVGLGDNLNLNITGTFQRYNWDTVPESCHKWQNWTTSQGFKSMHPGGAQFVFCDGSVHYLPEIVDYIHYQRLGDRRDGQQADPNAGQ
jgi:prepilin-type processing-associated H-X9-DG protein